MAQARLDMYQEPPRPERLLDLKWRSLGGRRGGAALADKCRRIQAERDREILRIVRTGGPKETTTVYGRYTQVCAERGWPIVCYRRVMHYIERLPDEALVLRTMERLTKGGLRGIRSTTRALPP